MIRWASSPRRNERGRMTTVPNAFRGDLVEVRGTSCAKGRLRKCVLSCRRDAFFAHIFTKRLHLRRCASPKAMVYYTMISGGDVPPDPSPAVHLRGPIKEQQQNYGSHYYGRRRHHRHPAGRVQPPSLSENFKKLVNQGFSQWSDLPPVIPGFMIRRGPLGNGTGGPGWNIQGEFASNGVNNPIKHTRGVISMARSMNPNSAGSQFFIMHEDAPTWMVPVRSLRQGGSGMDGCGQDRLGAHRLER